MSGRNAAVLAGILALCVVTGVLHFADAEPVVIFVLAAAALAGLAWAIGIATEAVGRALRAGIDRLPPVHARKPAGAVRRPLRAVRGRIVVAQTSILGSLFANALLVLGLAIVAGSIAAGDDVMRFRSRLPNDTATLLQLAVFIIVLLGLSNTVGDRASAHAEAISLVGAVCLLSVYGFWVWGYLRSDEEPTVEASHAPFSFRIAVAVLAIAGVAAAFVSDWFVDALDPAVKSIGISKAFTGIVIVGIAGNAVENVVGITLAAKGRSDLAISVVTNSVAQIAAFLFPALVLLSLFFEHRLTFVLAPVYIGALAAMAIAVWQITGDGKAVAFEGWALVAIYIVLAVLTFYE